MNSIESSCNKVNSCPPRIVLKSDNDSVELRQLIVVDADNYFQLVRSNTQHLTRFLESTVKRCLDLDDFLESIVRPPNPNRFEFCIWNNGVMVGSNTLTPIGNNCAETGSWVAKEYSGHNYAARARTLLVDFAFNQLHLDGVRSVIEVGNEPSRKSVERSGFVFMGMTEGLRKRRMNYFLENPNK